MSLRKSAISGTIWTTLSFGVQALIQILRLSILTRFLAKSDFGLVAIVVLVLGFTRIFADLGVSTSLFSRSQISKKEYSSLYWVSLLLSLVLYALLVLFSPTIANFYELSVLKTLIPVMGLDLIISTAGRQFRVFKEKALQFRFLATVDISSAILSIGLAMILAMNGYGVYSLIFSNLFASFLTATSLIVFGWKAHPLQIYINLKEGRSFYRIGLFQTGSQVFDYLSSQLDILIIGKMMSVSDLGVYNLIKQLVLRIYSITNPILTNVATPLLSKLQQNVDALTSKVLQLMGLVSLFNAPIYAILALSAFEVLRVMYGADYVSSTLMLQLLSLWGVFTSIVSVSSIIVVITGRTDLGLCWTIFRMLYNPLFVMIGSHWGLQGIVIGQVLYALSILPIYWFMLMRKVMPSITLAAYINSVFGSLLPAIGVCILIVYCQYHVFGQSQGIWIAVLSVLIFISMFVVFNIKKIKSIRKDLFK